MIDDGEGFVMAISPERATPGRFILAGLALATEVSQAFTNFFGGITMVVAADIAQKKIDSEFGVITRDVTDTTGIGAGCPEPKDRPESGPEDA